MLRLAFLASNNGTSFRAVARAIEVGVLEAVIGLLVSNKADAPALDFAKSHAIPAVWIPTRDDEIAADTRLADSLVEANIDVVILSGYLRKIGQQTLTTFEGRILNVHPGPLPKYGGQGMYGRRVHQSILDANELMSAATIHIVDGDYDNGPVIAARQVTVEKHDDVPSLEKRVMQAECDLMIATLGKIARREIIFSYYPPTHL